MRCSMHNYSWQGTFGKDQSFKAKWFSEQFYELEASENKIEVPFDKEEVSVCAS